MRNDYIVRKLYISFIVVSILSALTATVGMLIDNIIVGMYLGDTALGAMGIVGPVSLVFSAFGNICSGGGTARASQALGKADKDKMYQIFTVTILFVIVSGLFITVLGLLFTTEIAGLLGAKGELLEPSVDYLRGYFLGAVPTIMFTAMSSFVKIDGSPKLPLTGIAVMSVANIILDLMMVRIFHFGMIGMALATTISYILAVLTVCTHFRKKTSTLHLVKPQKVVGEMISMITTGAPTAISRICDTVKIMIINNMLVAVVGVGAVTALNIRTQANSFFGAFTFGLAQASIPLVGMFYGEEDKSALQDTLKNTFKIGILLNGLVAVILLFGASAFVDLMGVSDPSIRDMSIMAVRFFAVGMPLALINYALMSFYQSTKNATLATMICVLQSLVYILLLASLLIRPFAETGVWIAFLGAEILTLLTTFVSTIKYNKRVPKRLADLMRIKEGFGSNPKDRLELSIGNNKEELMKISQGIYKFGKGRNISQKLLTELSLCIEEMGGNVIQHAFQPGEKRWFDIMILDKQDSLIVRLRDNGAPFDPIRYLEDHHKQEEKYGLCLIQGIADDITYKRALDLNNLIIVLKK